MSFSSDKEVSFGYVQVREYTRIAGDHPDVDGGVPLSIGWAYVQRPDVLLMRAQKGKNWPRYAIDMLMPLTADERRELLMNEFGVSKEVIEEAERLATQTRSQRRETAKKCREELSSGLLKKLKRLGILKGLAMMQNAMKFQEEPEQETPGSKKPKRHSSLLKGMAKLTMHRKPKRGSITTPAPVENSNSQQPTTPDEVNVDDIISARTPSPVINTNVQQSATSTEIDIDGIMQETQELTKKMSNSPFSSASFSSSSLDVIEV